MDGTKSIFLDVDGAMSYAAVWLNGNLLGGWPYGYASWRLDLTPHLVAGSNLLAIRLDNAVDNSRWYPGAGIYRNLWLVKTDKTHVAQFGTYITTPSVSSSSATVSLQVQVENKGNATRQVDVTTNIYTVDRAGAVGTTSVATIKSSGVSVGAGAKQSVNGTATISNPRLWGPPPAQTPNLYVAVTTVSNSGSNGTAIDTYTTNFGIRTISYDANNGLSVNGQHVRVQGTCNHHDQGSHRHGLQLPRDAAPAPDPAGDGRQRAADLAQPAGPGLPRSRRQHGLHGAGRGLRLLVAGQDDQRLPPDLL